MRVIVRFQRALRARVLLLSFARRTGSFAHRTVSCHYPRPFSSFHTTSSSILTTSTSILAPSPLQRARAYHSALYPIPLPHTRVPIVVKAALLVACALPAAPLRLALRAVRVRVVRVTWGRGVSLGHQSPTPSTHQSHQRTVSAPSSRTAPPRSSARARRPTAHSRTRRACRGSRRRRCTRARARTRGRRSRSWTKLG